MKSNKYYKIIICIILLSFLITVCKDDDSSVQIKKDINKVGIVIVDKSVLRIDPLLYSAVVGFRSKGEIAFVLSESREKIKVGKDEECRYYVRFSGGYTGWIYGSNLKIFPANRMIEIEKYLSKMWAIEYEKIRKKITGIWESVEKEGVSKQSLELFEDGKYKSFRDESKVIEGGYTINFKSREIVFKNGTFFGNKITFFQLSDGNFLKKSADDNGIKFIKISSRNSNFSEEISKDDKSGA